MEQHPREILPSEARRDISSGDKWWAFRRAQSRQPKTYACPFCGELLHAMSEHIVVAPEGNVDRRRHAHTECVERERRAGRLPTRDEWKRR